MCLKGSVAECMSWLCVSVVALCGGAWMWMDGCGFGIGVAAGFMLWCVVCAPEMVCSFSFLFFLGFWAWLWGYVGGYRGGFIGALVVK